MRRKSSIAYDHSYDSVVAKKSWFYFADSYVMLGAGITGGNGNLAVNTTVNQVFLDGDVTVRAGVPESMLPPGDSTPANLEWVFHDKVGYLFPTGGNVTVVRKSQSGSWFEINDSLPGTILTADVFSLWFNHGTSPSGDSYACVVVPGVDLPQFDAFRAASPVTILANTASIQAVRHSARKLTQIAFFAPGTLRAPHGLVVTASQACLVMVDESTTPATVTVADPAQELGQIHIIVTEPGQAARTLDYLLPTEDNAGRSTSTASTGSTEPSAPKPLTGTVIAWSHQTASGLASYATDGTTNDDTKRWASDRGWPQWIEIDLGTNHAMTGWSSTDVSAEQFDSESGLHFQTWRAAPGTLRAFVRLKVL